MDRTDKLPRHLLIAFVSALVIYAGFFTCDQAMRRRHGPWEVQFGTNSTGHPTITVQQPSFQITNVQIVFLGETTTNTGKVVFYRPQLSIPFGKKKFEDLTYLPGSVAFDFFGHEVELLPRTLYINKKEYPWTAGAVYEVTADQKLPPGASYDPRKRKRSLFRR